MLKILKCYSTYYNSQQMKHINCARIMCNKAEWFQQSHLVSDIRINFDQRIYASIYIYQMKI